MGKSEEKKERVEVGGKEKEYMKIDSQASPEGASPILDIRTKGGTSAIPKGDAKSRPANDYESPKVAKRNLGGGNSEGRPGSGLSNTLSPKRPPMQHRSVMASNT